MTPDQVLAWNAKPPPVTYTRLTLPTLLVLGIALFINLALVHLHNSGAREMFSLLRARLRALRPLSSVVLRFCLGWVLLSSALALEPRFGNIVFAEPTLLAPDLPVSALAEHWQWLLGLETALGVLLFLGVYVRAAALGVIALVGFTVLQNGLPAMAYAPAYLAVASYLLVVGAGSWYVPMPVLPAAAKLTDRFSSRISTARATFVLRVLAGFNFLYLAVYFKVMQPNLLLGIIDIHQLPIFGFDPEVFTLIVAATEVSIGLLIIFGVLLRFLSVVLLAAFVFFSVCLAEAENLTSHMLYYGVALSFLFNGNGRWRYQQASDRAARIVVMGSGAAAVSACREIEKLLPDATNVSVTLVSEKADYQFSSMLPEIVSGAVQPGTIVTPLKRTLPRTRVLIASLQFLDSDNKQLRLLTASGERLTLGYDQLIHALGSVADTRIESRHNKRPVKRLDSVHDALKLKQHLMAQASLLGSVQPSGKAGQRLLDVSIIGGGERGSSLAIEVAALMEGLRAERQIPIHSKPAIVMFESQCERQSLSKRLQQLRQQQFSRAGIVVAARSMIKAAEPAGIVLPTGKHLPVGTVVNLDCKAVADGLPEFDSNRKRYCDRYLRYVNQSDIWLASQCSIQDRGREQSLSRQMAQGRAAATNVWACTQGLELIPFRLKSRGLFELYMGRRSVATLYGVTIPSAIARHYNRLRFLHLIPSLERKVRIAIDWLFDVVFSNDTSVLLDYASDESTGHVMSSSTSAANDDDMYRRGHAEAVEVAEAAGGAVNRQVPRIGVAENAVKSAVASEAENVVASAARRKTA